MRESLGNFCSGTEKKSWVALSLVDDVIHHIDGDDDDDVFHYWWWCYYWWCNPQLMPQSFLKTNIKVEEEKFAPVKWKMQNCTIGCDACHVLHFSNSSQGSSIWSAFWNLSCSFFLANFIQNWLVSSDRSSYLLAPTGALIVMMCFYSIVSPLIVCSWLQHLWSIQIPNQWQILLRWQ